MAAAKRTTSKTKSKRTARPRKSKTQSAAETLRFAPLSPKLWQDFEKLFGERGACGGCWCMHPRLRSADFIAGKGAANRAAMKQIVAAGEIPGILAYAGAEPIGCCAVAPRQVYIRLSTSRILKPIDNQPVWSIPCLFIAREWRRRGVSARLLVAAADFARSRGARIVEGYPVEPYTERMPDAFAWTGLPSAFRVAGFTEVARRSKSRPIMRRCVR